ncbi:MAG TPA: hypothetical protein VNW97_18665 [Candidatus Saccharimonadales bacterium]|jgi:hypothetical protein|nr:hypothetical protein [Candidatus Saccharimonadales bacterium]
MRVDVSGHQFTFPPTCACCNSAADRQLTISASKSSGKRVIHTKTQVWDIPYCAHCLAHVGAADRAAGTAKLLTILSLLAAVFLWYLTSFYIALIFGILAIIGTAILHGKQMSNARAMCSPACMSVSRAIAYLGWHGTLHRFEVLSPNFARDFMAANQRKLVNLTPQARDLLASSGITAEPLNKPRSARRYMT